VELQVPVFLFVVTLPCSLLIWTALLGSCGFVRDVSAMPLDFRLAARVALSDGPPKFSAKAIPGYLFGFGITYFPVSFVFVRIVLAARRMRRP